MVTKIDFNILTGINLLLGIMFFILLLSKKKWIKKELLFALIFIIPIINAFIIGNWYRFSISDLSMYLNGDFLFGLTIILQLILFLGLIISKKTKQKLVYSVIFLFAVIVIQVCTVFAILRSRRDIYLSIEPFCYIAYVLQFCTSIYMVYYYGKVLSSKSFPSICSYCGKENDSDAKYCIYCGNRI